MSLRNGKSYEVTVDPKGRIRLPSKLVEYLADQLGSSIKANMGFENSIDFYTMPDWEKLAQESEQLNEFDQDVRKYLRRFFGDSSELDVDDLNRVLIPKRYLLKAGIEKDAIILTYAKKMEVWSVERYEAMMNDDTESYAELAERVMTQKRNNMPLA